MVSLYPSLPQPELPHGFWCSLRHPDLGSLSVARDWTDWAAPGMNPPAPHLALIIDADGLLTLSDLVDALNRNSFETHQELTHDST